MNKLLVIPAMAEYQWIFKTLDSLRSAQNYSQVKTIVVINNPRDCSKIIFDNNLMTWKKIKRDYPEIKLIDKFSSSNAIPADKHSVGLIRRIGFSQGLKDQPSPTICFCMDADTLVESNYFQEVQRKYDQSNLAGITVDSWHQLPEDVQLRDAMVKYELYLRYYYRAVQITGTPYAFWSVGSSITFINDPYIKVGGFPAKKAGEDFYLLQKLKLHGDIEHIYTTRTYPAARVSSRVPFGTGPALSRYLEGKINLNKLPSPHLFEEIKKWFNYLHNWSESGYPGELQFPSVNIKKFLQQWPAEEIIESCRKNSRTTQSFMNRYYLWFNGLRIRQFINYCGHHVDLNTGIKYFWKITGNDAETWLDFIRRNFNRSVN
ncbi:MAG: hypothetical protein APR63_06655 [Desulfuromonas sp. SDB]|nr:MAG: hypothetical protein APR63_06655 [Desulfuromonas sp. SDB]